MPKRMTTEELNQEISQIVEDRKLPTWYRVAYDETDDAISVACNAPNVFFSTPFVKVKYCEHYVAYLFEAFSAIQVCPKG